MRDDRFTCPPPLSPAGPDDYPPGFKPGDPGFIEALAADGSFRFIDLTPPAPRPGDAR